MATVICDEMLCGVPITNLITRGIKEKENRGKQIKNSKTYSLYRTYLHFPIPSSHSVTHLLSHPLIHSSLWLKLFFLIRYSSHARQNFLLFFLAQSYVPIHFNHYSYFSNFLHQVCRGFYVCARDEELWRLICQRLV